MIVMGASLGMSSWVDVQLVGDKVKVLGGRVRDRRLKVAKWQD